MNAIMKSRASIDVDFGVHPFYSIQHIKGNNKDDENRYYSFVYYQEDMGMIFRTFT